MPRSVLEACLCVVSSALCIRLDVPVAHGHGGKKRIVDLDATFTATAFVLRTMVVPCLSTFKCCAVLYLS